MARDISSRLARALYGVDRPGAFCADGGGPAPLPGLEVAGLGPVGLPLTAALVPELVTRCRQAPYGKGEKTLVDTNVRHVWQLDPDRFSLINPDWTQYLATTVQAVQRELGLEKQTLDAHLYNLLLYEPGGFTAFVCVRTAANISNSRLRGTGATPTARPTAPGRRKRSSARRPPRPSTLG